MLLAKFSQSIWIFMSLVLLGTCVQVVLKGRTKKAPFKPGGGMPEACIPMLLLLGRTEACLHSFTSAEHQRAGGTDQRPAWHWEDHHMPLPQEQHYCQCHVCCFTFTTSPVLLLLTSASSSSAPSPCFAVPWNVYLCFAATMQFFLTRR